MSLTVALTPEIEKYVRDKVKSGAYKSASEYIREAIRVKQREERQDEADWLRGEIQKGLDDIENGRYTDYTDASLKRYFDNVARRGRARLQKQAKVPRKKTA